MVSAVAVKELEPWIDIAIETMRGTGTGNASGTIGMTETDAGSAITTRTALPRTIEQRESEVTKVLRSLLFQPHHHPPACLRPRPLSLTAHVAGLAPETPTAGTTTGLLGVLGIPETTSTTLAIAERENPVVPRALRKSTYIAEMKCHLILICL